MQQTSEKVKVQSGREITLYTLTNDKGMSITVLSLGATLTHVCVPDKTGKIENVVLGWKDLGVYEEHPGNMGAIIGRVAGRIYRGQATIDGTTYHFPTGDFGNTLHGGKDGFHKKDWQGEFLNGKDETSLRLSYFSKDQEEGFPGNLKVAVTYTLNNKNELLLTYEATTDKKTLVNLTNHAYFNLSGNAKRDILDEEVYIDSDYMYELDNELIPTGKIIPLEDEPYFDFRKPKLIGRDIDKENKALEYGFGYDHIWKLNQGDKAITLYDATSGRGMSVTTTESDVVMYTMNHADVPIIMENGEPQKVRYAVCFETQKVAIGKNEVNKEQVILKPGENYTQKTKFTFFTK